MFGRPLCAGHARRLGPTGEVPKNVPHPLHGATRWHTPRRRPVLNLLVPRWTRRPCSFPRRHCRRRRCWAAAARCRRRPQSRLWLDAIDAPGGLPVSGSGSGSGNGSGSGSGSLSGSVGVSATGNVGGSATGGSLHGSGNGSGSWRASFSAVPGAPRQPSPACTTGGRCHPGRRLPPRPFRPRRWCWLGEPTGRVRPRPCRQLRSRRLARVARRPPWRTTRYRRCGTLPRGCVGAALAGRGRSA